MPNPTRFPFGIALGSYNQFNNYGKGGQGTPNPPPAGTQYEQCTAGLLAQGSTAPDISFGSLFYTNNTGNTTITNFVQTQIGRAGSNLASGQVDTTGPVPEGKIIRVFFLDNSTQIANAGNIVMTSSDNGLGANSIIEFMGSNGKWWQIGSVSRPNANGGINTFSIGTATSINGSGINLAFVTGTATPVQVKAISGGQVGQIINLVGLGSSGISAYAMTGGNINIVGTNMYLIPNSGYLQFIKINNTLWNMQEIGTSGGVQ